MRATAGKVTTPAEDRFRGHVTKTANGCWLWQHTDRAGYGTYFFADGRRWLPHRWSYEHFRGPIPDGLEIDHLCRNRACVNPDHLEPVTRVENALRGPGAITECVNGHPYTTENTYIRPDRGTRSCRTCNNHRSRLGSSHKRRK